MPSGPRGSKRGGTTSGAGRATQRGGRGGKKIMQTIRSDAPEAGGTPQTGSTSQIGGSLTTRQENQADRPSILPDSEFTQVTAAAASLPTQSDPLDSFMTTSLSIRRLLQWTRKRYVHVGRFLYETADGPLMAWRCYPNCGNSHGCDSPASAFRADYPDP